MRAIPIALLILCSCVGCDDDKASERFSARGSAQKGPFLVGASIDVHELDADLDATGRVFGTDTADDLGQFDLPESLDRPHALVEAVGFYFDEIDGQPSDAELTLRSLVSLEDDATANVNVLSDIASDRMTFLVGEGLSFEDAAAQARIEVLAVFSINTGGDVAFDDRDVTGSTDADAALLAASAILQQLAHLRGAASVVAHLTSALAEIRADLEPDGTIDDSGLAGEIVAASTSLPMGIVRANLDAYYASILGSDVVELPPFEDFVDSDGDGVLNRFDPPGPIDLIPGDYDWNILDVPSDTCWPPSNPFPIPWEGITFAVAVSETPGGFLVAMPDVLSVFPDLSFVAGSSLNAVVGEEVPETLVVSTACSLAETGTAAGVLSSATRIDGQMTFSMSAATYDCSAMQGEVLPPDGLIPFPSLSDPVSGDCSITFTGYMVLAQ